MLHTLSEVTMVHVSFLKLEDTLTIELAFDEVTFVGLFFVSDKLNAASMELTVHHFSIVVTSISPFKTTSAIFLSVSVSALKGNVSILPFFTTKTMLGII